MKQDDVSVGFEIQDKKPQYEKPVVLDLGELPEVKGIGCAPGSSVQPT